MGHDWHGEVGQHCSLHRPADFQGDYSDLAQVSHFASFSNAMEPTCRQSSSAVCVAIIPLQRSPELNERI